MFKTLDTVLDRPILSPNLSDITAVSAKTFDFVIIGGGTAGLTLAARLTEDPRFSVVVLEAGNAHLNDPVVLAPTGWVAQLTNPEYDWAFETVPQEKTGNFPLIWNRGKGLGGSSAMNFLAWNRPQREEIDALEKLGNPGWNWDRFYQYAQKIESFSPPDGSRAPHQPLRDLYNPESVGSNGPVVVSFVKTVSGAEAPFQKSLENHGVETLGDALKGNTSGTWKSMSAINPKNTTRSYAVTGYLSQAIGRPNLTVLTGAYVNKIITMKLDHQLVADKVEFEHSGSIYQVFASKEVILSAGVIKSPHILELSGIGDRAILQPLGIPVIHHLPTVGANMQDHLSHAGLTFEMREDANIVTHDCFRDPAVAIKSLTAFPSVEGPMSLAFNGLSFLPLQKISENAQSIIRKQETRMAEGASHLRPGLKEQYDVQTEIMKDSRVPDCEIILFPLSPRLPDHTKLYISLVPTLSHPYSRGTTHAQSADPKVQPVIDPRYLQEDVDLDILVELFKFTRAVAKSEPFKSITVAEAAPGKEFESKEAVRDYVAKNVGTTWHTVGSLSMLPQDKGGVVDSTLKVYGTKNIRVVDISVLPLHIAIHPQPVVYAIAEQAADIIKDAWKN